MANVNKATVMGVLGRDPETKQFPNGGSVTTFSVATTEFWKDKTTGERKEATEWHRITTSNRLAEIASKYLKKGGKVYIEGSMRTRKYKDQSGADREVTEIRADVLPPTALRDSLSVYTVLFTVSSRPKSAIY